jgi:holo-[acyl-carrier protein] synthase
MADSRPVIPREQKTIILSVLPCWKQMLSPRRQVGDWDGGWMIVGTGIDIAEVDRIRASMERFGRRFLERVFTSDEIRYCESKANKAERYAGRFAAKEAAMKAIGTGWSRGVRWQDVEVKRSPGGRPTIVFHGKAEEYFRKLKAARAHLSITHTGGQAMAQVILESVEPEKT